jgi:hypothetical protein
MHQLARRERAQESACTALLGASVHTARPQSQLHASNSAVEKGEKEQIALALQSLDHLGRAAKNMWLAQR